MKGQAYLLKNVILISIVTIIIFAGFALFGEEAREKGDIQACKTAVLLVSTTSKYPINFIDSARCPAAELDASEDEFVDELVHQMEVCWEKFGEGKLNPVSATGITLPRLHCFSCAKFTADEDIGNVDQILDERLKENEYLKDAILKDEQGNIYGVESSDKGWSTVLTGSNLPERDDAWEGNIEKGRTYNLMNVFLVDKDGIIFPEFDVTSKLMIVDQDDTADVCEYVYT